MEKNLANIMEEDTAIKRLSKMLLFAIIPTAMIYSKLMIDYPIIWWPFEIYFIYLSCRFRNELDYKPIKWFSYFVAFSALYGIISASNYWHWKLLVNNCILFYLPIISYIFSQPVYNKEILGYLYARLPLFILCILPFASMSHFYGRIVQPFTLILLFWPLLESRMKKIAVTAVLLSLIFGFSDRSDNIRLILCIAIGYIFNRYSYYFIHKWIKRISLILLFAPFVFFTLAVTDQFNVFDIGETFGWESEVTTATGAKKDLFSDTRSGLYIEVIASSIKNDCYIIGRSLSRGYDSSIFSMMLAKSLGFNYGERGSSETGILNVFTYMGIVGVILLFIIYASAVRKSVFQSNNRYIPLIGLYLSFRWAYCWVEEYQRFDFSYIFLWILIGMCLSPYFREMNDDDFETYIDNVQNYKI